MSKNKSTTTTARKEANPAVVTRLADAIAKKHLAKVLSIAAIHEHCGSEIVKLSKYFEETSMAYVRDVARRESGADEEASIAIGLAIGRRMGGAR